MAANVCLVPYSAERYSNELSSQGASNGFAEGCFAYAGRADKTKYRAFAARVQLADGQKFENGEPLLIRRNLRRSRRRRYSLAWQAVESDRLATPNSRDLAIREKIDKARQNGDGTHREIRAGVEIDKLGQPVAYWIAREHPGESHTHSIYPRHQPEYDRIEAYDRFGRR